MQVLLHDAAQIYDQWYIIQNNHNIYYMTTIVWAIWLVCLWAILSRITQKVIAHFLIGTYKKALHVLA